MTALALHLAINLVCFSPHGDCTKHVVDLIAAAQKTVRVSAYNFTSSDVSDALIAAQARGVDVRVVLDRSNKTQKASRRRVLVAHKIPTCVDSKHRIFHDKFIVVDGHIVEEGSFNYTDNAERFNAENFVVIDSVELATQYAEDWKLHSDHSACVNQ